jgi:drug/metabolite transporter (DMT)-like permease
LKAVFVEFKKHIKKLGLLGLVEGVTAILWSYGILYGNLGTMAFIFRLSAVFAVLFGFVILRERLSKWEWTCVLIAIIGTFILVYPSGGMIETGNIIILIAAVFSALSIFLAKVFVKNVSSFTLAYGRTFFLFFIVSIYAFTVGDFQFEISANILGLAFACAFLGAFIASMILYKSLSFYELAKAVAVKNIEPFFVVILSIFVLATIPSGKELIGGILIVTGVIVLSLLGRKNGNAKNIKAK